MRLALWLCENVMGGAIVIASIGIYVVFKPLSLLADFIFDDE